MLPRLNAGRHPDWDLLFWDDFSPTSAAQEPSQMRIEWDAYWGGLMGGETREVLGTGIAVALLALLATLIVILRRRILAQRRIPKKV